MIISNLNGSKSIKRVPVPTVSSGALVAALLVLNNRIPGSLDYLVRVAALINAGYDIDITTENPHNTQNVIEEYYNYLYVISNQMEGGDLYE